MVLLQIFPDSDSENRLTFGKVKSYKNGASFLGHPVFRPCLQYATESFDTATFMYKMLTQISVLLLM